MKAYHDSYGVFVQYIEDCSPKVRKCNSKAEAKLFVQYLKAIMKYDKEVYITHITEGRFINFDEHVEVEDPSLLGRFYRGDI